MPYPAHPTAEAANHERDFLTAKARYDANKNILKTAALKKALDTAGQALAHQCETDMAAIRHNGVEHFLLVETALANAAARLKAAEDAHARWQQNPQEHDADIILATADYCAQQAQHANEDGLAFGASWLQYRTYNCGEASKYLSTFLATRGKFIEEGKSPNAKIIRLTGIAHEALALKNLHLSQAHANDRVILEKQGAAAELFRSIDSTFKAGFMGLKHMQNAMGLCESIRDAAQNPRLKKEGNLPHYDGLYNQLGAFRKVYVQSLASMEKTYQTGVRQFSQEDAQDPDIRNEMHKSRALIDDTRQKLQFLENGYKDAGKNMERIRSILKK